MWFVLICECVSICLRSIIVSFVLFTFLRSLLFFIFSLLFFSIFSYKLYSWCTTFLCYFHFFSLDYYESIYIFAHAIHFKLNSLLLFTLPILCFTNIRIWIYTFVFGFYSISYVDIFLLFIRLFMTLDYIFQSFFVLFTFVLFINMC